MQPNSLADQPVTVILSLRQAQIDKSAADKLRQAGSRRRAEDAPLEDQDKKQIQNHVGQATDNQKVHRPLGIPDSPQNTGPDIVQQIRNQADEVNDHINQ